LPIMVAKNLLDGVLALPLADRLELFERLRANLEQDANAFPVSPELRVELERRRRDAMRNPDEGYSAREVATMLRARRRA
jgi:putative addiction module component (TIGR02574 family)